MTPGAWLSKSTSVSTGALLHNVGAVMKIEILPCFSNSLQTRVLPQWFVYGCQSYQLHSKRCFTNVLNVDRCVISADEFIQMPDLSVDILHLMLVLIKGQMHDGNFCRMRLHGNKSFCTVTFQPLMQNV